MNQSKRKLKISPFLRKDKVSVWKSGVEEVRIWHALDGKLRTICPKTERILEAFMSQPASAGAVAASLPDQPTKEMLSIIASLTRNRFLVPVTFDKTDYLKQKRAEVLEEFETSKPDRLYLFPSGACNQSCIYCYIPKSKRDNPKELMSTKIHDIAINEFLDAAAERGDAKVQIRHLGGEPLYDLDLFKWSVDRILERSRSNGIDPLFVINSNGTLIDSKVIKWLETMRDNMAFVISLDGPKTIHDKFRVYRDGSGTFSDVLNALRLLQNAGITTVPHAVIGGHNKNEINALLELLAHNGIGTLSFSFVSTPSDEVKSAGVTTVDKDEKMDFLVKAHELAKQYAIKLTGHWRFAMVHLIDGNPFICRGGTRSICVLADGGVYPCQRITWDSNAKLAQVKPGFLKTINLKNTVYRSWIENAGIFMDHCQNCGWLGIHAAGCPPITERGTSWEDCSFHGDALKFAIRLPIEMIRPNKLDLIVNGMMTEQ